MELDNALTDAKQIGLWFATKELGRLSIKRNYTKSDGTRSFQRLPIKFYRNLDEAKIKTLIESLNGQMPVITFDALILNAFKREIDLSIPTMGRRKELLRNLNAYALAFFCKRSHNPLDWYNLYSKEWAEWLLTLNFAPSTYKHITTSLNKFMTFLHERDRSFPLIRFTPISRLMMQKIKEERELEQKGLRHYISEHEMELIIKHSQPLYRPYFSLAYKYGLRRNELAALNVSKVRKGYLLIDRQFKEGELTLPKYRKKRKVSHWFSTPEETYTLVNSLVGIYYDKIGKHFNKVCWSLYKKGQIKAKYVLHDCRHSFVSNAIKLYSINDVKNAAGHSDIRTTSSYMKDTRELDDEQFIPN